MEEGNDQTKVPQKETFAEFKEVPITIGKSPVMINVPIGIGCWAWGDSRLWGYTPQSDKDLEAAFRKAVQMGVNFFDTAEVYGRGKSEQLLGTFVKNYVNSPEYKLPVIVASKFIPLPWRVTHGSLKNALVESLKRLGLQSIDLYQVHGPAFSLRSVEVWADALADCVKEGLIKSVGVSNYNPDQVKRTHAVLAAKGVALASNQVEFSLLRNNPEKNGLLKTCQDLGVSLIAYSPLAMGRLSGKYTKETLPQGNRKFGIVSWEEYSAIINKLKEIGQKYNKTPSQVALNWVICKGAIPIVGVKNVKQVEENLQCLGWRLTSEELSQLDKLAKTQTGFSIWQE